MRPIVCDICKKTNGENGTAFNNEPITMIQKSCDGEKYVVMLKVEGVREEFYQRCQNIIAGDCKPNPIDTEMFPADICNQCKRSMVYNLLKYGKISETTNVPVREKTLAEKIKAMQLDEGGKG